MSRRASILVELAAALAGSAIIGGMVVLAAREHREVRRLERTMVELDQAQNLLDSMRHGTDPDLPPGWRVERLDLGEGVESLTVHGPLRTRLTTLRRIANDIDGTRPTTIEGEP